MAKRLLKHSALFLLLSLILFSCLEEGGNYTQATAFGIMKKVKGIDGLAFSSTEGVFSAPSLNGLDEGTGLFAEIKVDWDNQPSQEYITANVLNYVEMKNLEYRTDGLDEDYGLYIEGLSIVNNICLWGRLFLEPKYTGRIMQAVDFNVFYEKDSIGENGYPILYLKGKRGGPVPGEEETLFYEGSVDLNKFIKAHKRDTVVDDRTYTKASFYLKYQVSKDSDNNPIYHYYKDPRSNERLIEIFIPKE